MHRNRALAACLALGFSTLVTAEPGPVPAPAPPEGPVTLLTRHALDGAGGTLRKARIVVEDGRIRSIGAARSTGEVIDLRDYTVLPGWIDTHVHLSYHFDRSGRIATASEPPAEAAMGIAQAAWDSLMGGFTTVQSVGDLSERPLRDGGLRAGVPAGHRGVRGGLRRPRERPLQLRLLRQRVQRHADLHLGDVRLGVPAGAVALRPRLRQPPG